MSDMRLEWQLEEQMCIRDRIYPEEIAALQRDYAALWGPLSDLLKKLSALVEL